MAFSHEHEVISADRKQTINLLVDYLVSIHLAIYCGVLNDKNSKNKRWDCREEIENLLKYSLPFFKKNFRAFLSFVLYSILFFFCCHLFQYYNTERAFNLYDEMKEKKLPGKKFYFPHRYSSLSSSFAMAVIIL